MANDSAVASGAASGIDAELCANCSQPIKQCSPWGWHHADGPVLCYNESELVATPRTHNPSLQSPEAPIRTGLEGEKAHVHMFDSDVLPMQFGENLSPGVERYNSLFCACGNVAHFGTWIPAAPVTTKDGFEKWWPKMRIHYNDVGCSVKQVAQEAWHAALAASAPEGKVTYRVEPQSAVEFDGNFSVPNSILTTLHDSKEDAYRQVDSWLEHQRAICRVFEITTTEKLIARARKQAPNERQ